MNLKLKLSWVLIGALTAGLGLMLAFDVHAGGGGEDGGQILPFNEGDDTLAAERGPQNAVDGPGRSGQAVTLVGPEDLELRQVTRRSAGLWALGHQLRDVVWFRSDDDFEQWKNDEGRPSLEVTAQAREIGYARSSQGVLLSGRFEIRDSRTTFQDELVLQGRPGLAGMALIIFGERSRRDPDASIPLSFDRVDAVLAVPLAVAQINLTELIRESSRLFSGSFTTLDLALGVVVSEGRGMEMTWASWRVGEGAGEPVIGIESNLSK